MIQLVNQKKNQQKNIWEGVREILVLNLIARRRIRKNYLYFD